jgi:hypothetical protein
MGIFRLPKIPHHAAKAEFGRSVLKSARQVEIPGQRTLKHKQLISRILLVLCMLSAEVMQGELDRVQHSDEIDFHDVQLRLFGLIEFDCCVSALAMRSSFRCILLP